MANSWTQGNNQAIIDTEFADPESFHGVIGAVAYKRDGTRVENAAPAVRCKSVRWNGQGDGDELIIVDREGDVLFAATATSTDPEEFLIEDDWTRGWAVTTLDGGTLYVNFC